ncbi:glycosyltransferase [Micromonospora sp. NPDC049559]|uniref:glycosyltransferase family 4 protein n=1 Tax=Micromonospora sp. NPDC049559 TaxID=3155923 RepID=UPI003427E4AA
MTAETRYLRTPDGAVWTREGPAHRFWTRYLSAFDQVRLVARTQDVPGPVDEAHRVDGTGVEVWPVPYYVGPRQYLLRRAALVRSVRDAAAEGDAVILRVPSPVGTPLAAARERRGLPYAVEVVGDPYDVFAPGVVRHPARPLLRRWLTDRLRHQCREAVAVSYVTAASLQRRYPARPGRVTIACSSVDLPEEAYLAGPRSFDPDRPITNLVSVGSLEQLYKGIDTLLEALARLAATGLPLRLTHVGDGRYRPQLERLAARLGLADRVTFTGRLPAGPRVRERLDDADLFVLPSRAEGLPRALIEAMARALPAVATNVGGIPELLPAAELVPPESPVTLAEAIRQLVADPARLRTSSARNLARARDYSEEVLARRRDAFYGAVRAATERHPATGARTRRRRSDLADVSR